MSDIVNGLVSRRRQPRREEIKNALGQLLQSSDRHSAFVDILHRHLRQRDLADSEELIQTLRAELQRSVVSSGFLCCLVYISISALVILCVFVSTLNIVRIHSKSSVTN